MKILRSFSIIAVLALVGNTLGYVRDLVLAINFGASNVTDAYFAAFFVPNTLHLILLSSSVASVFLPVFVKYFSQDEGEAWSIASTLFNLTFILLLAIVAIASLTVKIWIPLLFSGLDAETLQLTVSLTLIMLSMLLFMGLSNLISNILYSFQHFAMPAFAPIVANVFVIIAILMAGRFGDIRWVAFSVVISIILQILVQIPILRKYGGNYRFVLRLSHPAVIQIGKLALPMIIYSAIAYASLAVERNIASTLEEGTISAINFAIRLFSLPIALFAGSLGTVIYPQLSLEVANESQEAFANGLLQAVGATTLFLLPLSLFLFVNSEEIVRLLFGYGQFSDEDVILTTMIFKGYLIGMLATGITRILQRGFYALQNTSALLGIELVNFIFYLAIVFSVTPLTGARGLGLARGASFVLVALLSVIWLSRQPQVRIDPRQFASIVGRYCFAGTVATAVWLTINQFLAEIIFDFSRVGIVFYLVMTGVLGFIVFTLVAYLLRLPEVENGWAIAASLVKRVLS